MLKFKKNGNHSTNGIHADEDLKTEKLDFLKAISNQNKKRPFQKLIETLFTAMDEAMDTKRGSKKM